SLMAGLTTPRMAAFRPGQSPPLVRMPTTRVRLWIMAVSRRLGRFLFIMAVIGPDGMVISRKPRCALEEDYGDFYDKAFPRTLGPTWHHSQPGRPRRIHGPAGRSRGAGDGLYWRVRHVGQLAGPAGRRILDVDRNGRRGAPHDTAAVDSRRG